MKPLKRKVTKKYLWGFDIETEVLDGKHKFLMGSIVGDCNINKVFYDRKHFIDFIIRKRDLFRKGYIVATNLNFDIMELFKKTKYFRQLKPIIRNSNMLSLKLQLTLKETITFIDSMNFLKISVEKMGNIIKIPKLEKPKCLGKRWKNNIERLELEEYNIRDSMITYKFMCFLQDTFNSLGCNMRITIASTSMDLFRRQFLKEIYYQPDRKILKFLFKGYYGGRTEVLRRGKVKNLNCYDVNSLYPSVMIKSYPYPNRVTYSKTITHNTIKYYEGVCKVKVKAPELYIPYLPYRLEDKLIFPTGTFTGYYTFFELRKALKLGYNILRFYDGVVYTNKFHPFKEYVEYLYNLRQHYKDNKDIRQIAVKLLLNCLYGKFAQKIESKERIIHKSLISIQDIVKAISINESGEFYILNEPYKRIPVFVNPIFSIYTTAYARDVLYNYISRDEKIYYYDTDSLFTESVFKAGSELGALKLEYKIVDGVLVKPKMYYVNDLVKCKGAFSITKDNFIKLLDGSNKSIVMRKFTKFKEANKRKLDYNEIIFVEKFFGLEDNKRKWTDKFNPKELQNSRPIVLKI